tara:strand:- start:425 stop:667 length:243 start_codon:yes stop_codon:yes gene_type:complete
MAESKFIPIKQCYVDIGLDHTSPSQFNNPLDVWVAKYVMLSSQERRKLPPSVSMEFGGFVGQAVQDMKSENLTLEKVYNG